MNIVKELFRVKLFETTERWTGKFSITKEDDNKLGDIFCHGEVKYTPEDGVSLSYSVIEKARILKENEIIPDTNIFYGILDSGKLCTLLTKIATYDSSQTFINGQAIVNIKINFLYMFIGDNFIGEDEKVKQAVFTTSYLQEFFFSETKKDFIKYSNEALVEFSTNYGTVKVHDFAKGIGIPKDINITSLLFSLSNDISEELEESFNNIKHHHANLFLKKDMKYALGIEFSPSKQNLTCLRQFTNSICDLFAILMYCPTYPESISISIEKKGNFTLYPSIGISKETIELWQEANLSYDLMPIKSSLLLSTSSEMNQYQGHIDIKEVMTRWLEQESNFSIIAKGVQSRTKYINLHTAYSKIVLYAAQLEAISQLEMSLTEEQKILCESSNNTAKELEVCLKKKRRKYFEKRKYSYPIKNYGNLKIKEQLYVLFTNVSKRLNPKNMSIDCPEKRNHYLGKCIADIRNEIVHSTGKPSELEILNVVEPIEVGRISKYLEMVILGYVLNKLEVHPQIISKYQDRFTYP